MLCFQGKEGRDVPSGNTRMKHRHLRQLGWKLIAIPFWTCNKLEREGQALQREFWRERLEL